jgi:hypothetical protein
MHATMQNPNWVICKEQRFISYSFEGQKSKIKRLQVLRNFLFCHNLVEGILGKSEPERTEFDLLTYSLL